MATQTLVKKAKETKAVKETKRINGIIAKADAKEVKLLTARELADMAGISPMVLRRLLRAEFNKAGKTVIKGNRSEYRFNPNDAVTQQIIARAKAPKTQPEAKKTAKPQPSTPVAS